MKKVFLGGTCNESTWRNELISLLEKEGIEYFNPVVDDWTPECQEEEYRQKEICDVHLYLITKKMKGVFSIAEAVASCQFKDKEVLFAFADFDGEFDTAERKSLDAVGHLIARIGGGYMCDLESISDLAARISTIVESRVCSVFSFSEAIKLLQKGKALRRSGWNGKNMFVIKQVPAHIESDVIPNMQSLPQSAKDLILNGKGFIDYTSQCLIYNGNTGRADSWVPSISDVFADDWELVE